MQNILEKLKSIKPKSLVASLPKFIESHSLTVLIVIAGLLVGVSLFSVSSLTQNVSNQNGQLSGDTPVPLSSLNISPETETILLQLQQDEDISISSNIATYRRSAFSSATNESNWVIEAAEAIEDFNQANEYYPTEAALVGVLRAAAIAPEDSEDRTVNSTGSDYSYSAENCDSGRCSGFFLSARVGSSIYQLGETDSTKRSWVNATAEALDAYSKSQVNQQYPTENDVTSALSEFYEETLSSEFNPGDPAGAALNDDDSAYSYRGINCGVNGCSSFVLRTTFKDGALYFQQSQ